MFTGSNRIRLFELAGHEIAIDPVPFGLLAIFFVWGNNVPLELGGTFLAAAVLSIFVHELGHAIAIRGLTGEHAVVVLGLGGVTFPKSADPRYALEYFGRRRPRTPGQQLLISLAGPGAGFVAGLLAWAVWLRVAGGLPLWPFWNFQIGAPLWFMGLKMFVLASFVWGVANLLPAYPLDGGQAFRAFLVKLGLAPRPARRATRFLGMGISAAAAVWALTRPSPDLLTLFFCLWIFLANFHEGRREGF